MKDPNGRTPTNRPGDSPPSSNPRRPDRRGSQRSRKARGAEMGARDLRDVSGGKASSRASQARLLALEVMGEVRNRNAFVRNVIESVTVHSDASSEDKAFARLLSYGVISTQGVLDDALDALLTRPADVQPGVRDALRISAYEILFLDKSPYAAVDQGVELVRVIEPRAAGMANAVLRKLVLRAESFPWGDPEVDTAALARQYGFPTWLATRIIADRGREEAVALMEVAQGVAPVYVGVNPYLATDDQVVTSFTAVGLDPAPFGVPGCYLMDDPVRAVSSSELAEHRVLVSDAAAQLVAWLATPLPGEAFLEVGSGRGTKTILLQGDALRASGGAVGETGAAIPSPPLLYAIDDRAFKAQVLADRLKAFAVPGVTPVTGDATKLKQVEGLPRRFSGILVDAPCSGLGTLRRHPEERWRITPEGIAHLSSLQGRLLQAASHACEIGGFIVYATCTVLRQEDEDVIERFLTTEPGAGFEVEDVSSLLPADFAGQVTPEGYLRTRTYPGGPDAHFAVKLVRVS